MVQHHTSWRKDVIPVTRIPGSTLCPLAAYSKMCEMIPAPPSIPALLIPHDRTFRTLTYSSCVYYLKQLLTLSGFDADKYSGHSFRRVGAATTFKAGITPDLIRMHGDWHSGAYLWYLTVDMNQKLSVSEVLADFINLRLHTGNYWKLVDYSPFYCLACLVGIVAQWPSQYYHILYSRNMSP